MLLPALTFVLPQTSTMAPKIDFLYNFIVWFSVLSLTPTIAAMLYFAWKYREKKGVKNPVPLIEGNPVFEWSVSIILSIFFLVIFIWGLVGFNEIHSEPVNPYEISVIGQQWMWSFQYPNGKTTTNEMYAPMGQPVKLILSSKDVIHDFFVPNFRLKQDVVPGMYTTLWFEATEPGENQIFCAQYCGTAHSNMIGKVIVLKPDEFKMWLNGIDPTKMNPVKLGEHLFRQRNCIACHSINGAPQAGPTIKGLFGKPVKLGSGQEVVADENYIRESIVNPMGQVVQGFKPVMPTYKGLLSEEELNEIVAYIKSLKE